MWHLADYLALNVSSPNTPGLRGLQGHERLTVLLRHVTDLRRELGPRPLLLKIAPDLGTAALRTIVQDAEAFGLDGIIATNTSLERDGLRSPRAREEGGLSGAPLRQRSMVVLRELRALTSLPIVSVGGIGDAHELERRLEAGASLVQLYTAFIYQGPGLVRAMLRGVTAPPAGQPSAVLSR